MSELRVVVAGAGLGGLVLAHGLRRAGIAVTVHEADPSPTARPQGYRLHIDHDGADALRAVLPTPQWERFLASGGRPAARFVRLDHATLDVEHLLEFSGEHLAVDRLTLRRILHDGLEDSVTFGQELVAYETAADGRPTAVFADGTRIEADVLVGADGVHSAVRRQYLPHQRIVDTGARMIYGTVDLTPETRPLFRDIMFSVFTVISGPDRTHVGVAPVEFPHAPQGRGDYMTCSFGFRPEVVGCTDDDLRALSSPELLALVAARVAGWHPEVAAIVEACDPDTPFALTLRQCVPIAPWPTSRVTLVGDAAHAMSPGAGAGANTAMRDGARLAAALTAVAAGAPLLPELRGYEAGMIDYGFAAVLEGARNGQWSLGQDPLPVG
jgi:2-polyprenyl-6-methoxyphenol hydroxylase-like FAD-dependent oxidoreductase